MDRRAHGGPPSFRLALLVTAACLGGLHASGAPEGAAQRDGGPPRRIVCLVPAVTEMLFAIGAGPQVVAVSSFDRFPPEVRDLPRAGALVDPDLERIFALRPDLVVVYATQADLRRQLDRAGIPQFHYKHAALGDVAGTLRQIAARVGRPADGAAAAAKLEAALEAVRRRVAGRDRPSAVLVIGREPDALRGIHASGGEGFLHEMLELAGGTNVFADVARESLQATTELILARRPGVVIELRGAPMTAGAIERERAAWRPLASLPAVRSGRVHLIDDERTVVPGPRIAEGAELIARALHPGAFQ